jgi:predicted  nucleic acid-binding Zn-ribbon protein
MANTSNNEFERMRLERELDTAVAQRERLEAHIARLQERIARLNGGGSAVSSAQELEIYRALQERHQSEPLADSGAATLPTDVRTRIEDDTRAHG